jgi:hypothetical protein
MGTGGDFLASHISSILHATDDGHPRLIQHWKAIETLFASVCVSSCGFVKYSKGECSKVGIAIAVFNS